MKIKQTKYRFLVQQYKNNIFSYSLYMLKDKFDAEDVTQEVLIKIWNNMDKFNLLAAKSWITKATHNLCIDYLRKRKSTSFRQVSIDDEFAENYMDSRKSPNDIAHLEMMTSKLKEVIGRLPESLRSVLVLYEIQGLKYKEISDALEMPINSVKVYLLRARRQLQEELKNYEPQEVL